MVRRVLTGCMGAPWWTVWGWRGCCCWFTWVGSVRDTGGKRVDQFCPILSSFRKCRSAILSRSSQIISVFYFYINVFSFILFYILFCSISFFCTILPGSSQEISVFYFLKTNTTKSKCRSVDRLRIPLRPSISILTFWGIREYDRTNELTH